MLKIRRCWKRCKRHADEQVGMRGLPNYGLCVNHVNESNPRSQDEDFAEFPGLRVHQV